MKSIGISTSDSRKQRTRWAILALAAAVSAAASGTTYAITGPTTDNWTGGAGDGKFISVGNWSAGSIPGTSSTVVFNLGTAQSYSVTLGATSSSSEMIVDNNSVTLGSAGYDYTLGGSGAVGSGTESLIVGNGAVDTAANLTLGTGGYGKLSGVNATLGETNGSMGTLTLGTAGSASGSKALNLSGALAVGYGGNGTLTVNAGSASVGGDLDIAALAGSIGKVDIELSNTGGCGFGGGTPLQVGGNLYVGGSAAGAGGTGTLIINGTNAQYGSGAYGLQVTGTATIYSGGSVTLKGGLLEAASISNAGTLNFTGGTLDLTNSDMTVGTSGLLGSNVALGSGMILQISGTTTVAAGGALTISGGELDTGALSSAGGSISFTSGTLGITNSDLIIDTGGPLGNNVSLASGQTLNVKNNNLVVGNTAAGTLTVGSGAFVGVNQMFIGAQTGSNGKVIVDGTVGGGAIFVGGNATGAGGTGTLTVNSGLDMYGGTITVWQGGTLTDNAASNLSDTLSIQSGGVMATTGGSHVYARSVTNGGLIEVQTGTLSLFGTGTLTNTGGTIQADNGTTVQLYAATVSGGSLADIGTGNFVATSAVLDGTVTGGLTNNAVINVPDSGNATTSDSLTLQGTLINNGQINITSTGDTTWLYINGATTISGTGVITLADNGGNTAFIAGTSTGLNNTLTNGGTIQGSGTVGNSIASNSDLQSFTNTGTIDANVSGKTLVLGGGYTTASSGTLEATNGGTLLFSRNAKVDNAGGTISASGAHSVVSLIGGDIQGGTLNASGGGQINLFGSGHYLTTTFDGTASQVVLSSDMAVSSSNTLLIRGSLQNNGNLTVQGPSGGYAGGTLSFMGATTLSGTGTVNLASGSSFEGDNTSSTLTNQSTIAGAGSIISFSNTFLLDNTGTVNANVSGGTLTLYSSGGSSTITNTGTLEATGGGLLNLEGATITNTGGTILAGGAGSVVYLNRGIIQGGTISAATGGVVDLQGGTVQGGTLITDAQSTIYAGSGKLDGSSSPVTNAGNLQATYTGSYPGNLTLAGTINNTGTITIHSGAFLYISGAVTLNGNGILQLNNNNANPAVLQGNDYQGSDSLINNSTIQGAGTLGDPNGNYTVALTNTGTIDANVNGETLDVWGAVTNTGTLEATNGGTLYLHTTYTQNNGITYFGGGGASGGGGGGGVQFGGGFTLGGGYGYTGGSGDSYTGGDFSNTGGSLDMGIPQTGGGLSAVAETFTITHNYSASGSASTNFHLGGTGQGLSVGYDYLKVGGAFSAGGQLGIQFVNNFQNSITATDTFDLITAAGGITGSFGNAVSGGTVETTDGFGSFNINYGAGAANPNDVILSNFTFTPGGGGSAGTAKIGTPFGTSESFSNIYSGTWIDPAGSTLTYTMTSGALFTKIDAFRPGYDGLTITVDGHTYTGFGGDSGYTNTFDFTGLAGGGATSFSIGDIATNVSNPFAVQLEFSTPTASFTVTPASTPEPTTWLLFALGTAAMALYPRRRRLR